ncbi:MAG: metal-dependent hydrolase [Saprospiraceae bacterium]|uniref:Metal-dependent hydrolase n=1 Tax=Candidatus Opimibacter skivensis TaxID=2982028 RepID=A0A9D7STL1_9BACT|nr:metal-dependent hydrolase [Candidatus Opimibacter skivensis]
MDSLTHLVLGAAIGEVVLGKKIGNRALIWCAIGETIPDFDVIGNLFMSPTGALGFHRGFTHSIMFALIAPLIFGGLVYQLYHTEGHKKNIWKYLISALNFLLLFSLIVGANYLFKADHHPRWWLLMVSVGFGIYLTWRLYKFYLTKNLETPKTTYGQWYLLFFLAFSTHILIDSCTTYGTQLFLPFSNYRVAFNNIAVADLFYTIPFLICAIIFPFFKRGSKPRAFFNWLGIGISCAYMLFTIINKVHMDNVFEKALAHRGIEVTRCKATPTILNNFLWNFVAEGTDKYYVGLYSNFDTDPNVHYLNELPKNDSIKQTLSTYKEYKTILWFSDGLLAAFPADTMTVLSDLRYGGMTDTIRDYHDMIFNFYVQEKDGGLKVLTERTPSNESFGELLKKFIKRVEGY